MQLNRSIVIRVVVLISLIASLTVLSSRLKADTGDCGGVTITLPFTDVMGNAFFCQIAAAYFSGLTNGTTATTYSPTQNVTREQIAAFTTRTLDQSLKRGNKRAALNQWWTTKPHYEINLGSLQLTSGPVGIQSDGTDIWAALSNGSVARIRASDGRLLETWDLPTASSGGYVLIAMGRVFISGNDGSLAMIDPSQPAGTAVNVADGLQGTFQRMAFDGDKIWLVKGGSVMMITPGATLPWQVTTVTNFNLLEGIIYDGSHMWVTNTQGSIGHLYRLDGNANIIQTVSVGSEPQNPIFDGTNIWVPNRGFNGSLTVVRASTGSVIATLSDDEMDAPEAGAFDGERILIVSRGGMLSLWKATNLTPIGFIPLPGASPFDACSDGLNFWVALTGMGKVGRF
jgi:hypothetical protein